MEPAQRKACVPGRAPAVAVLALLAAFAAVTSGCTTSDSAAPSLQDGKPGPGGRTATAEPGKYQNLPEACGAVSRKTLKTLLPGADEESEEAAEKVYAGEAAVTFDTDRSVGCRWKLETPEGSRHLTLDFERVVSYDPEVSDDDRALAVYGRKAAAAHVPDAARPPASGADDERDETDEADETKRGGETGDGAGKKKRSPSGTPTGSPSGPSAGSGGGTDDDSGAASGSDDDPGADDGPGSGGSDDADDDAGAEGGDSDDDAETAAPRLLDDLADDAFLDDKLATADSGVHRDITVVFRSSNVIVTIEYDQWSSDKAHIPASAELQENAEDLAHELTGRFGG
ncbi:DUF3558 domain-containing protein [Streptomyces sp. P1-3]|uniref:DUF3558 domain-containing protein n=1 Tax=Streptomyces sp. P1-3 TaxID=3421658 RepID=UPI003D35F106